MKLKEWQHEQDRFYRMIGIVAATLQLGVLALVIAGSL